MSIEKAQKKNSKQTLGMLKRFSFKSLGIP